MAPATEYLHRALIQDGTFARPLLGALVYTVIVLAWRRPLQPILATTLGLVISAWVLGSAWPAFLVVCGVAYVAVASLARSGRREVWARICLIALAAVFVVGRAREWDHRGVYVSDVYLAAFYLDMWMVLRLFTFIWEVGGGLVPLPGVMAYAAWVSNPLLLGGPLVRLSQWPASIDGKPAAIAPAAWTRALEGTAMVATGLAIDAAAFAGRDRWGADAFGLKLASVLFVGPWVFYLTIGGFYRIVEWLGSVCGVEVPVSFRFPFFRRNIAEFWARWNLTATTVFRDYFFYNRWGSRGYNIYLNTMIVFVSVGLWHGSNVYWIAFGALHGLFFCTYLWTRPRIAPLSGRRWVELGSIALTYVAICAAWYLPSKIALLLTRR